MEEGRRDRRRNTGDFRVRPRRSPVTFLVLTVAGVLVGSAVVASVMGGGLEESTPHGQLLTELREVADRQDAHYGATGRFAGWLRTLELEEPAGMQLVVIAGDDEKWEAVARHPVGLTCTQGGSVKGGRPVREGPICFTTASR